MRITKALFQRIVNHPGDLPPEEGGIIGCTGNAGAKIIDIVDFDKGNSKTYGCSYSPDVSRLNSVIEDWLKKGISFCGIFHVHYFGVRTLSDGDKEYISAIMGSMPDVVDELFFPIVVMPEREMVSYRATRKDGTVRIEEDRIQVESESYSGPVFL